MFKIKVKCRNCGYIERLKNHPSISYLHNWRCPRCDFHGLKPEVIQIKNAICVICGIDLKSEFGYICNKCEGSPELKHFRWEGVIE